MKKLSPEKSCWVINMIYKPYTGKFKIGEEVVAISPMGEIAFLGKVLSTDSNKTDVVRYDGEEGAGIKNSWRTRFTKDKWDLQGTRFASEGFLVPAHYLKIKNWKELL